MVLHRYFLILIFAVVSGSSFAQKEDFLVTAKNDTLVGKIKLISFDTDQAQIIVDGKKQVFQSFQVKTLRVNGEMYNSVKRQDKYRIMKLLKEGYLSVYGYREPNQSNYDGRFFAKRDGTSLDMPNLSFKKMMSTFLSDCREVSDGIRGGTFARKDFEQIVDLYNQCIEANTRRRYAEKPAKVVTQPPVSNAKVTAIDSLKKKVAGLPDFENKKNAEDLIGDMADKASKGVSIPPYLLEALKGYLGDKPAVKDQLSVVLNSLK